ncbi:MAG: alanine--tRNA ligase [Rhodothermales bacterium]
MKTAAEIRAEFLSFFEEKQHTIVPSDSLVPGNDPTLMFTNAGMNQFKDVFLGEGSRSYVRAADTQKCLRVSGKHNDLDEVGYDTYHHTFFEMLGNWSFGDYFKKEAIQWAWELLVTRWGLDPGRLYVTVHEGDAVLGLEPDEEAAELWKTVTGISPDHVLYCGSKDNFWMMGDTGPCGPCSEIHIDLRTDDERARTPGASLVNMDDPRVMEIWNLVFIQYNAQSDGSLKPLKAKHVDTGMGFERVVAVLQQKTSNYDTDLFLPILDDLAKRAPVQGLDTYVSASMLEDGARLQIALRVMADHVRTIGFAVADGVMPSNAGRGYVIRRILRRAVRYGYQTLGFREPVLCHVLDSVEAVMGTAFPELVKQRDYIRRVVRAEEESFLETLGTGIQYFELVAPAVASIREHGAQKARTDILEERALQELLEPAYGHSGTRTERTDRFVADAEGGRIPGAIAFLLHDTYGFPIDLTQLMAREAGLDVDMEAYETHMTEQKERARSASSFKVDMSGDDDWVRVSSGASSVFTGYGTLEESGAAIRSMRTVAGTEGQQVHQVILDRTPFYAESGGQVGDTGTLDVGGDVLRVLDTRKAAEQIVHFVDRLPGEPREPVIARVDADRRSRIAKHHSVTHLLHAALKERLGDHVAQKGSLVAPDHLRFDFSHFERMSDEDLTWVERRVNEVIQQNIKRGEDRDVPIAQALERGATALFGEKYGETVRIITFDRAWSVELCGGTHVDATGDIGLFRFRNEGSVAAGVRRVEAVAGMDALRWMTEELEELQRVRDRFKALQRPVHEEVAALQDRTRQLERDLEQLQVSGLHTQAMTMVGNATEVDGVRVISGQLPDSGMEALRSVAESLREELGGGTVTVFGTKDATEEKVYLACSVSDDVIARGIQAGKLVGTLARMVGGGGGGRPGFATAGGKNPEALEFALVAVATEVRTLLKS